MPTVTFRSGLNQPDTVKRWSWHYLLPLVKKVIVANYLTSCVVYTPNYPVTRGRMLIITSPWVIIHLGTILCIYRTDVVHWFRSLSGTCQSITSAIWAPCCTNNSPQGRMRKQREEGQEGRRKKGWIHLPEISSFFFLEKNLLFRQLMFIWAESFFIPTGG